MFHIVSKYHISPRALKIYLGYFKTGVELTVQRNLNKRNLIFSIIKLDSSTSSV